MWSIASLLTAYGLDGVSSSSSAIGRPSRPGAYSELEPATTIAGASSRSRIASNRPIVPQHVDLEGPGRLLPRDAGIALRGQVEDDLGPRRVEQVPDGLAVEQVDRGVGEAGAGVGQGRGARAAQPGHLVALRDEELHEMAADEPAGSGDQAPHAMTPGSLS